MIDCFLMQKVVDEWNRLKPFFDEIMSSDEENIIIVSHGDLLSVFNTMFLGLEVEVINISDMSYVYYTENI